jgi:hypothetical protein
MDVSVDGPILCHRRAKKRSSFMLQKAWIGLSLLLAAGIIGCECCRPEVTCYSLSDPNCAEGIPYYLPKPLLIISKNFRYISDTGEGKSMGAAPIPGDKFDDQAKYADLKANVSTAPPSGSTGEKSDSSSNAKQQVGSMTTPDTQVSNNPGVIPPSTFKDGVTPDTFYTYQIVFVPDLTQKYAIKVKGGAGEFRAAMNLVNGWMFTGLGPFYLKDSSTAQNIMACGGAIALGGRGVADVVSSLADLSKAGAKPQTGNFSSSEMAARITEIKLLMDRNGLQLQPYTLPRFAEIHIFEPEVVDGHMVWRPIVENSFDRMILGVVSKTTVPLAAPAAQQKDSTTKSKGDSSTPDKSKDKSKDETKPDEGVPVGKKPEQQFGEFGAPSDAETAITKAVANQFIHYLPQLGPQAQAGSFGSTTTPNTGSNVTVNVNSGRCLFPWLSWPCCKPTRIQQTTIVGAEDSAEASLGTVISQRGQQLDVERKLTPDSNTDK